MKKFSKELMTVLCVALCALFLQACMSTGTGKASVVEGNKSIGPLFENQVPGFSINYPSSWKKGKLKGTDYLFLKTGIYGLPNMRVSKNATHTESTTPEQAAKAAINTFVKNYKAKNCKVLYTKRITLADGTPAVEMEIQWKHPDIMLYSCLVQTKKGDVALTATTTDMAKVKEKNKAFIRTLIIN
ncbi:hypothetical protein KAJ27_16075 [bacterium]|nr:hypothetical protein [bacterium]